MLANSIEYVDEILYYYVKRADSITQTTNYAKIKQNVYDALYHFDTLCNFVETANISNTNKPIILSHFANSLLSKISVLHIKDRKKYINELYKREITDMLLVNSTKRKLKVLFIKVKLWYNTL